MVGNNAEEEEVGTTFIISSTPNNHIMITIITSFRFAPASAFLPEHDYGVVLSPYLWGISNTCRVSKRARNFHRIRTMVRTVVRTLSKLKMCFRCTIKRVTRACNASLYDITSFLRRLATRKAFSKCSSTYFASSPQTI